MPGKTISHQAFTFSFPAASKVPHVTVSCGTPMPKKERADSIMIAAAALNAIETITGPIPFGKACLKIMRAFENPSDRAAVMKSISRVLKNSARVRRATSVHAVNPMISTIFTKDGFSMAARMMISRSRGREIKISMLRDIIESRGRRVILRNHGTKCKSFPAKKKIIVINKKIMPDKNKAPVK